MIGDVKMQTIKRRTGLSLTGDRPLFLALNHYFLYKFPLNNPIKLYVRAIIKSLILDYCFVSIWLRY